jgi:hypothetical protein
MRLQAAAGAQTGLPGTYDNGIGHAGHGIALLRD